MPCGTKTCGLCTFTIASGEPVFMLIPETGMCTDRSFPYIPCDTGCRHAHEYGVTMHPECCTAIRSLPSAEMCRLTETEAELNIFEQASYIDEVRSNLAKNTAMGDAARTISNTQLREELAQMMVSHLPTYNPRRYQGEVSLKEPVYAIRVQFLGETYIAELTNTRPEADQQPVYEPEADGELPVKLYFGQNQFGIKTVLFFLENDILEVEHNPLLKWQDIAPGEKFWYQGDGHKMRSLRRVENPFRGPPPTKAHWPVPMEHAMGYFRYRLSGSSPPVVRFQGVPINGDDIEAYSVACTRDGVLWIESHSPLRRHNCYEADVVFNLRWHYFPVRRGEKLAELWQRDSNSGGSPDLIFVTSQRKIHVIGTYVDPDAEPRRKYTLIEQFPPEKHELYFSIEKNRIGEIATPFYGSNDDARTFTPPRAETARPPTLTNRPYFLSVASLDNVVIIQPCMGSEGLTGLVFTYLNRTQASVGQVKRNGLRRPELVHEDNYMSFQIDRQRHEEREAFRFSSMVAILPTELNIRNDSIDIPCHGKLEFWWSESGTIELGWMPSE